MQNNFGIFYHSWSRISIEDWTTATVAFVYYLKTDFIGKREPSATYTPFDSYTEPSSHYNYISVYLLYL